MGQNINLKRKTYGLQMLGRSGFGKFRKEGEGGRGKERGRERVGNKENVEEDRHVMKVRWHSSNLYDESSIFRGTGAMLGMSVMRIRVWEGR